MTPKFKNYLTEKFAHDAVEYNGTSWYIKLGFAGFNSPTNNGFGYKTREATEAAILRYQSK